MDPIKPMDDVGLIIWGYRIYALDVLEAKVISHQPSLPKWFHGIRSILDIRYRIVLR